MEYLEDSGRVYLGIIGAKSQEPRTKNLGGLGGLGRVTQYLLFQYLKGR